MNKIDEFNPLEKLFFKVLTDFEEYLPYLVLVGGWVPYLYVKYMWNNLSIRPVTTTDIDFGFYGKPNSPEVKESIYSRISSLKYKERHFQMNRLFPIVPILENAEKTSRLTIEFITTPKVDSGYVETLVGREILVNRLEKFDILLSDTTQLEILNRTSSTLHTHFLNVPLPHIFLFHKALTFIDREDIKKGKDLYYIYYILRFHPEREALFKKLHGLKFENEKTIVFENLKTYFSRISGPGCLMVERENGPDPYIPNVRKDVFNRFNQLFEAISV